jgi:hypothetical protein
MAEGAGCGWAVEQASASSESHAYRVIASEARRSIFSRRFMKDGLLRCARNDESALELGQLRSNAPGPESKKFLRSFFQKATAYLASIAAWAAASLATGTR